ncbi:MAG: sigma-70 family RNA polymerase sigma factor [Odoribacter sp.]|nr:sigma-70 family RNA polymerase sigma factor [Odoribacter sp.]
MWHQNKFDSETYFSYICPSKTDTNVKNKTDIEELGRRVKRRDEEAFRILYTEAFPNLQQYAMRYVYNWQEAEDLVQEAFFSLWCNLDQYDDSRNIITYLLVIVKNSCLNYLRELKIRDQNMDKMVEALLFSNLEDEEPDEQLIRRLNEVLSQLPEKQREVLLKHVVDKKTLPDIARELNIAESTAKTHYKRAIAVLRENLRFILLGF